MLSSRSTRFKTQRVLSMMALLKNRSEESTRHPISLTRTIAPSSQSRRLLLVQDSTIRLAVVAKVEARTARWFTLTWVISP